MRSHFKNKTGNIIERGSSILTLRPYQQELINQVYQSMLAGNKKILTVLPTGGGKTAVFAWMADQTQAKGNRVWFLVHRKELLDQTVETFSKFGIQRKTIDIGMVGTIANRLDKYPKPDLIVLDEAHHSTATTWRKILDRFPDTHVIGLTATPCRLDGKPLGSIYDDLVIGVSTADLIAQGYLSDFKIYSVPGADTSKIKVRGADYDQNEASNRLMKPAVYGNVVKHLKELAPNARAICFCTTIKHSEAMAAEFNKAGIKAEHFDGKTPKNERKQIVDRFRSGETQVLCNVDIISEGFDLPACDAAILLRPTLSLSLYLQQVGRALRPAEGKTAIILDHVGNALKHGFPDDLREWSLADPIKSTDRFTTYGKLAIRTCANCYAVYKVSQPECPLCGAVYETTREEIKQIENVKLQELERKKQKRKEEYKKRRSEEIETEDDCRSYQDLFLYAKKCGHENPKKYAIYRASVLGYRLPWQKRRVG